VLVSFPTCRSVFLSVLFLSLGCRSDPSARFCGNGALDKGEVCDDGNTAPGDGCRANCTSEGSSLDGLDTAVGCPGVFNPDQILDYHFTMAAGDFSALKNDSTNSQFFQAELSCGNEPSQIVGVRRKRSGLTDKPGLKVDFNFFIQGGNFQGLKKLSLESGISEGSTTGDARTLIAENLAWQLMVRSGAYSGRAAFARIFVNGELIGVYNNVEQVDKRFLQTRLGDNSGWLFKLSGVDDGYKTNETLPNPFEDLLCILDKNPCAPPAGDLKAYLSEHLEVTQLLLMGGVNAIITNHDAPIFKNNNFYFYDWEFGPRVYFPWDLDSVMGIVDFPIFGTPQSTNFTDNLLLAEIDRAQGVAGAALDADPFLGSSAGAFDDLRTFWQQRHPNIVAEVQAR
jgi:cysteine-rich repeat protein